LRSFGSRDVQIAADHERQGIGSTGGGKRVERGEELHLRRKVLAAVGDIDRCHTGVRCPHRHNSVLVVERGMRKGWPFRRKLFAYEQTNPGIPLRSVPVAPVVFELAQKHRDLVGRRLDLLQAQDVWPFFAHPVLHLIEAGADTVDVPGANLERCGHGDIQ
jgi:hypothetical protein